MKYELTKHAEERLRERSISEILLERALDSPTEVEYDNKQGKYLVKKVYEKENKKRLLLVIGVVRDDVFHVITVIDTSKIDKYL